MIGLVIVSHSQLVAEGVKALADAMTGKPVPIAAAGGVAGEPGVFGSDAIRILVAIEEVYSDEGVLVFTDIGSTRLNAETAIDLLEDERRPQVRMCPAPLVEGVLSATVQSGLGGTLDEVMREAIESMQRIMADAANVMAGQADAPGAFETGNDHGTDNAAEIRSAEGPGLGSADRSSSGTTDAAGVLVPPDGEARQFTIDLRAGLHARPAALFVEATNQHAGVVLLRNVTKGTDYVNACSINAVLTSDIAAQDTIEVVAAPQADALFAAIDRLVDDHFGESAASVAMPGTAAAEADRPNRPDKSALKPQQRHLQGIFVSPGFAIGPLHHVVTAMQAIEPRRVDDVPAEIDRFRAAVQWAKNDLIAMLEQSSTRLNEYDRKIFDAHRLYLSDPDLIGQAEARITGERFNAEAAWSDVVAESIATYRGLQNPLLHSRADDLDDVASRVLRHLIDNDSAPSPGAPPGDATGTDVTNAEAIPAIAAYDTLRPSDVLSIDLSTVRAVCAANGGQGSHAAILAGALPVPVVFGLGKALSLVAEGTEVLVDGTAARLTLKPETAERQALHQRQQTWQARQKEAKAARLKPAITRDGHRVRVAANLASLNELAPLVNSGADEIGLFRTEFLYMNRDSAPGEEAQLAVYRQILEALSNRPSDRVSSARPRLESAPESSSHLTPKSTPRSTLESPGVLTIRTMDIGGDKPVPYLERAKEANPYLGWRGIRHSLDNPALFATQLAAILRASAFGPVRILLPLVSTLDELLAARQVLSTVQGRLASDGVAFDERCPVGIMIEVPAAAELSSVLAEHVDFFSLGTNDLTQYVMAADRANSRVQSLFDPLQPAVLKAIKRSVDGAHEKGIWIGMCGAMAGSELAAPLLLGLGLDEFSMNHTDIAMFKLRCADLESGECQALAAEVLELTTVEAVRSRLEAFVHG